VQDRNEHLFSVPVVVSVGNLKASKTMNPERCLSSLKA